MEDVNVSWSYDEFKIYLLLYAAESNQVVTEEEIEFIPCTIKIPNAFTPNDNGQNDVWNIQKLAFYPECRVKVYNRWGDVVFSSQGYDVPWDGKHRLTSVDLPSAVYYYVIENVNAEFVEEGSFLHGYVTIIR